MRNHSEKQRDMCRSILPSKSRRGSREALAQWKRHHRRIVRHNLRDALGYDWLDYEGHVNDDTNRPNDGGTGWDRIITHLVQERRYADKTHPFENWVKAIKCGLPGDTDENKYMSLKAMLPDNLIGRHALSHVKHLFVLPGDEFPVYSWRSQRSVTECPPSS